MIDYNKFCSILNGHIFEGEKRELLRKIADNPNRFIGLFRPTKPEAKILQNILQSHEIRFGDAMEELISEFLKDWGFKILPKQIIPNPAKSKNKLVIDHYFTDGRTYYFIEQKIRDDHDSSKKRGQIDNFEAKLEYLYKNHQQNLVGIMYFIDPDLIKNKNYYDNELKKMKNIYGVELYLFYGKELFKFFNRGYDWDNLISWLTKWKMGLPDLPEINFDNDPESSFNDIKNLEISVWRKILENNRLWEEGIMLSIFKSGETLKMISEHYEKKQGKAYKKIAGMIKQKLQAYYKHQYSANNRVEVQD